MYKEFAYWYDYLMEDMDTIKWADYVETLIKHRFPSPCSMVDLGCGTGSFSIEMHGRGYEMTGVDSSVDMLSRAMEKALDKGLGVNDILFLNQNMWEIDLYGTADVFVSLVDSINYITDPKKLKKVFRLVHNYLNPGGLFIFDINTPFKFENILADNAFHHVSDDISYIWQNKYSKNTGICIFDLTFFVRERDGMYRRFDEVHRERAYSTKDIVNMACDGGFSVEKIFDDLSLKPLHGESKRAFFVLVKI